MDSAARASARRPRWGATSPGSSLGAPGIRRLRRAASAGRWPISTGSGRRSGSSSSPRPYSYSAVLASDAIAWSGVVPGCPPETSPSTSWAGRRTPMRSRSSRARRPASRRRSRSPAPPRAGCSRQGRGSPGWASVPRTGSSRTCPTSPRPWSRSPPPRVWAPSGPACAPELGPRSVVDRLGQLEPTVLLTVAGYGYRDRSVDRRAEVAEIAPLSPPPARRPRALRGARGPGRAPWDELVADEAPLEFTPWPSTIRCSCCSRRDDGQPKAIVHGHGGILLELSKAHALSWDLKPGGRLLWFSTTSWMMWNALVAALLVRSSIVMLGRRPGLAGRRLAMARRGGDPPDVHGRQSRVPGGLPQGGPRARARSRPPVDNAGSARRDRRSPPRATATCTTSWDRT